jgi:hypothetical protein
MYAILNSNYQSEAMVLTSRLIACKLFCLPAANKGYNKIKNKAMGLVGEFLYEPHRRFPDNKGGGPIVPTSECK